MVVAVLGVVAALVLCCAGILIGGNALDAAEETGSSTRELPPRALLLLGATGVVLGGSIGGVLLLRGRARGRAGYPASGAGSAAIATWAGMTAVTLCCLGGYLGGVALDRAEDSNRAMSAMPAPVYGLLGASGLLAAVAVGALVWRRMPAAQAGGARRLSAVAVAVAAIVSVTLCCLGTIPLGVADEQEPGAGDLRQAPLLSLLLFGAAVLVLGGAVVAGTAIRLKPGVESGPPRLRLSTIVSPRGLSRLLFQPRDRYQLDDRLIIRLGLWRTVLAITTILVLATRGVESFLLTGFSFLQHGLQVMQVGTLVVLGSALAAVVVAAGRRGAALRAVLRPVLTVSGAWALFGLLYLYTVRVLVPINDSVLARLDEFPDLESAEPELSVWFGAVGHLPVLALGAVWSLHGLWMILFFLFAVFYLSRYAFRSAEAHPMLPPMIVTGTSWCVFLLGTGLLDPLVEAAPSLGSVPLGVAPTLQLVVSATGTATVTALAIWEIVRLRQRGVTLRAGPWR